MNNPITYLTPKTIATYQSQYNGEVKVVEQFGERKIYAGGLLQSGSIIKQLWEKPLRSVGTDPKGLHASRDLSLPRNILILGFGGGTATQILTKKYPKAHITGIEIDPVMIQIYNEYFTDIVGNENFRSVQLIQANCFHWINKCEQKYDLVLVDLYLGNDIPKQLYDTKFVKSLKKILNSNGSIIINHLFFDRYKDKIPLLIRVLEKEFINIKLIRNLSNIFVLAK